MNIDVEKLICKCVPGGDICDPQEVADSIREYFESLSSLSDVQPDGPRSFNSVCGCQTNEAAPMSGYAVPSRAAGGEDQKI